MCWNAEETAYQVRFLLIAHRRGIGRTRDKGTLKRVAALSFCGSGPEWVVHFSTSLKLKDRDS